MGFSAAEVKFKTYSPSPDLGLRNHWRWSSSCFLSPPEDASTIAVVFSFHALISSSVAKVVAGANAKISANADERKPSFFSLSERLGATPMPGRCECYLLQLLRLLNLFRFLRNVDGGDLRVDFMDERREDMVLNRWSVECGALKASHPPL